MAAKQSSETLSNLGRASSRKPILGQKEAREEKEMNSDLSRMGEGSRESSHDLNQKD